MEDDGDHEEDERHVVDQDGQLPQDPRELQGEPHDEAGEQQPQCPEGGREEEQLLAAVVLAHVRVLALVAHVLDHLAGPEPLALLRLQAHLAEPMDEHHAHRHEEEDAGPGMEPAADVQAAEEVGHPAEDRRPDREPREQGQEEEQGHGPMDGARGEPVPDDLLSHDDIFGASGPEDGGIGRGS